MGALKLTQTAMTIEEVKKKASWQHDSGEAAQDLGKYAEPTKHHDRGYIQRDPLGLV